MLRLLIVPLLFLLISCRQSEVVTVKTEANDAEVYTFYRNSLLDPAMRIHVSTYDSKEGGKANPDYNRAACEEAAQLFREMDATKKHWWCEKGKYRS